MALTKAPNGIVAVRSTFGDPYSGSLNVWESKNLVPVHLTFPFYYRDDDDKPWIKIESVRMHKLIADNFTMVQEDVWAYARSVIKKQKGYDHTTAEYDSWAKTWLSSLDLDKYDGMYNHRTVRDSTSPSMHSFGIAIDMDASSNPRQAKLETTMPDWYIDLWRKHGWFWGGDFRGLRDPMHFQFATGC